MTDVLIAPNATEPILQDEEHLAHIFEADKIAEAVVYGLAIQALCGQVLVPSRDPKKLPTCQACKEIFEGLILPLRTDHTIKDDL